MAVTLWTRSWLRIQFASYNPVAGPVDNRLPDTLVSNLPLRHSGGKSSQKKKNKKTARSDDERDAIQYD